MTKRSPKSIIVAAGFLLLSVLMALSLPIETALAGNAVWANRTLDSSRSMSYFGNEWDDSFRYVYGAAHSFVIHDGIYGVNDVNAFVNFLIARNRTSSGDPYIASDRTGAAFIVHTILGRNGDQANANGGRVISDRDFNDLRDRLNAATINWNTTVCTNGVTTMSVVSDDRARFDVQRDRLYWLAGTNECKSGITITDRNGSVYKMLHECANPVGELDGIATADFNLNPSITASPTSTEGGGSSVSYTPSVNNTGSAQSSPADWQVTNFNIAPGAPIPAGGTNGTTPVLHYGNAAAVIASGNQQFQKNSTTIGAGAQTIGDYAVGTRICYALSVKPYDQNTTNWRHGTPFCVIIAKSPKIQVRGGDIRVGSNFVGQTAPASSNIITSRTTKNISGTNRMFGSWGEYAISATGLIQNIGSGAAYAGPGLANATNCTTTFLTFSNATTGNCQSSPTPAAGSYSSKRTIPNVTATYSPSSITNTLSGTVNLGTLDGTYKTLGADLTINGGTIPKGRTVVINTLNPNSGTYGTVTITGNVSYTTDPLTKNDEIPQAVIIAGNIYIAPAVTNIDSWLVAAGTLNTCYDVAIPRASINSENCKQVLTVNGPVMANQIQLWRTGGSNTAGASGDPAEIFNLRPDAYLWGLAQNEKSGRIETVYEQDLPPRF